SADWKSAIRQTGSLRYAALRHRTCAVPVAQVSNLSYRGFPIRRSSLRAECQDSSNGLPTGSRRYGRLEVCATRHCATGPAPFP
ncbi:MAG TPA: hypothetical protein VN829_07565, partial [Dongiaceae bacterium]|nr:hypothetical protein [Dongiaceae bacterium]